jgi:hypothetical protein
MKEISTIQEQTIDIQPSTDTVGTLHVSAKLRYRKIDQFLLNFLFGEDSGVTAPISDMSEASTTIQVVEESGN